MISRRSARSARHRLRRLHPPHPSSLPTSHPRPAAARLLSDDAMITQTQKDGSIGLRLHRRAHRATTVRRQHCDRGRAGRTTFRPPTRNGCSLRERGFGAGRFTDSATSSATSSCGPRTTRVAFLRTDALAIDLERNLARSVKSPAQLQFGQHTLTARSFTADLKTEKLHMESVRGAYATPCLAVVLLCFATVAAAADADIGERALRLERRRAQLGLAQRHARSARQCPRNQGPMSIEAHAATACGLSLRQQPLDIQGRRSYPHRAGRTALDTAQLHRSSKDRSPSRARKAPPPNSNRRATLQNDRCAGAQASSSTTSTNGVVRLQDHVWFSNGKDEFRGDVVLYNVRDERVQINPDGGSSGRVRGIIRPAPASGARGASAEAEGSSEKQRNGNGA